jgi:hypothetical protein
VVIIGSDLVTTTGVGRVAVGTTALDTENADVGERSTVLGAVTAEVGGIVTDDVTDVGAAVAGVGVSVSVGVVTVGAWENLGTTAPAAPAAVDAAAVSAASGLSKITPRRVVPSTSISILYPSRVRSVISTEYVVAVEVPVFVFSALTRLRDEPEERFRRLFGVSIDLSSLLV